MKHINLKQSIQSNARRLWQRLLAKDEERPWIKFVLSFIGIALITFVWGNNTIWDYYKVVQRAGAIRDEINEIKPQLEADSIRLSELKELGEEVEVIARERYLMKSPGEEIFLLRQDSSQILKTN